MALPWASNDSGGCPAVRFVLRDGIVSIGRSFLRIFLWPRNPVSRKRRPREAETRFECRLRRRKSEHLALPKPLGGHVGEAPVPRVGDRRCGATASAVTELIDFARSGFAKVGRVF